jgi:hypothetical protein
MLFVLKVIQIRGLFETVIILQIGSFLLPEQAVLFNTCQKPITLTQVGLWQLDMGIQSHLR